MSVNTKNGSDNASCATNTGPASPLTATPEPKANNHHQMSGRSDTAFASLQNQSLINQHNVRTSKVVRILTVFAYIVAVSMAAIILSIYYTFVWNPYAKLTPLTPLENTSLHGVEGSFQLTATDRYRELRSSSANNRPLVEPGLTLQPSSDESTPSSFMVSSIKDKQSNTKESEDLVTKFVLSSGFSTASSSHVGKSPPVVGERLKVSNLSAGPMHSQKLTPTPKLKFASATGVSS